MDGDYVLSRDDLDDVHLVEPDDDDEPAERHVSPNAHVAVRALSLEPIFRLANCFHCNAGPILLFALLRLVHWRTI